MIMKKEKKIKFVFGETSKTKLIVRLVSKKELIVINSFDGRCHPSRTYKSSGPLLILRDFQREFTKERGIEYLTSVFRASFSDSDVIHAFIADVGYPNSGGIVSVLKNSRKDTNNRLIMFKIAFVLNENGQKKWNYIYAEVKNGKSCKNAAFTQLMTDFKKFKESTKCTIEPIAQIYGNAVDVFDENNSMPPMAWLDTDKVLPYYHKTTRLLRIFENNFCLNA